MPDKVKKTVEGRTKTEQERMKEFFAKYEKLCEEDGFRLVINPAFRARDDGSWSVVLQTSVGKLSRQVQRSRAPEILRQKS